MYVFVFCNEADWFTEAEVRDDIGGQVLRTSSDVKWLRHIIIGDPMFIDVLSPVKKAFINDGFHLWYFFAAILLTYPDATTLASHRRVTVAHRGPGTCFKRKKESQVE
ncbi:MAG: hypothetical protein Q9198_003274 [Flavoplaca austrocitrina]